MDSPLHSPYIAEVWVWGDTANKKKLDKMAFMPVHEVLEVVVEPGQEATWATCGADQKGFEHDLRRWGDRVGMDTRALADFIPIALWGDSAEFSHRETLFLLLWTVLSGTCRARFWLCAFGKRSLCQCGCYGRCTMDSIWSVVAWMFRALMSRTYPSVDHTGAKFPKGSFRWKLAGTPLRLGGACVAKCGDWSWFKSALGLRGWRGEGAAGKMCWLCAAGFKGEHQCFDFSFTAAWRKTATTMGQFWRNVSVEKTYVSGIWSVPGFHIPNVRPDWMHVVCLGVVQYLLGNVLWECMVALGGNFSRSREACHKLVGMLEVCAKRLKTENPLKHLTVTMVRPTATAKPKLKTKAAQGRRLVPIVREMLATCIPVESPHERLRLNCVAAIAGCYSEMEQWVPASSPQALSKYTRRFLLLCCQLRNTSSNVALWCLCIKQNLLAHLGERALTNPRKEWSYLDEAEIGDAVLQARFVNRRHLPVQLIERYRATFTVPEQPA